MINKVIGKYFRVVKLKIKKEVHITKLVLKQLFYSNTLYNNSWIIDRRIPAEELNLDVIRCYSIMGTIVELNNVSWNTCGLSGFEYPSRRFDKIKLIKFFDQGNDVNFVWQLSRFHFGVDIAKQYYLSKDKKHYLQFKNIVIDWIENNLFLKGINWTCTMEVAIRAINIIVAIDIFGDIFNNDIYFKKKLTKLLVEHALYISTFPEISEDGYMSNHITANYAGLLFLALSLKDHKESESWLDQAVSGLEACIRYQTYEDGVNFEASIAYHRLVLEMFGYSAILCKSNKIKLSQKYFKLLFKMFEYSAAYIDINGNAPQIGDNDSGRILAFTKTKEHDHSYLLELGEHIFDYSFKSQCKMRENKLQDWLPEIEKTSIRDLGLEPRITDKSISFPNGGAYILKNEKWSFFVALFPIGQNGKGGHNHVDIGSFTLSCSGAPIIIDPGTYSYTVNVKERNIFRDYFYHNIVIPEGLINNPSFDKIWQLNYSFNIETLEFKDNCLYIKYKLFNKTIERKYLLFDNRVEIHDRSINSAITSNFNLNPDFIVTQGSESDSVVIYNNTADIKIFIESNNMKLENFEYSPHYGVKKSAYFVQSKGIETSSFKIKLQ